ncbi:MAG TPA: MarR family transcriptional regulator [Gemmatimonadales bacterium]|nr:MarR family transcriptional regulator [Gemmatimonadales bacterium]
MRAYFRTMALEFLSPLHKASRQITMYLEDQTRALGVSPLEGHVLTYLRKYAPAPVGELVRVFGIKQSTLTSLLDRLERSGLARREPNPADRRSFLISLTERGRDLTTRLNRLLEKLEDDIRARLRRAEAKGFHAVMAAVEDVTQVQVRER